MNLIYMNLRVALMNTMEFMPYFKVSKGHSQRAPKYAPNSNHKMHDTCVHSERAERSHKLFLLYTSNLIQ